MVSGRQSMQAMFVPEQKASRSPKIVNKHASQRIAGLGKMTDTLKEINSGLNKDKFMTRE